MSGPKRRLGWYDGFVFSLTMPAALVATLGYSIGALGAWAAILLWGVSMLIATAANWIYSEMAAMFPDKLGGIALYAHEGWRRYSAFVGPVATFGYWFAWTGSIAVYGEIIGSLVVSKWLPGHDFALHVGSVTIGLADVIALAALALVWAVNVLGIRPTVNLSYLTAAMLMVPVVVFILGPVVSGDWSASNLTWRLGEAGQSWHGWQLAIVWLYIMLWTSLGVETCATFAPEYRNPVRDTTRALRAAALFSLAVFVLLPLGITGEVGERAPAEDPLGFYADAFDRLVGGASGLMVAMIVGSLLLVMNTSIADGSRALYGIANEGMTVRQLRHLNRFGVPSRCLAVDLITNVCLILFLGSTLTIVAAGNLGYILAHVLALSAFVLLRRDRPGWPRPIRLHAWFVPGAAVLAVALTAILGIGALSSDLTGYGGWRELVIALGVLSLSIVLYLFRVVVQDRERVALRNPSPAVTSAATVPD